MFEPEDNPLVEEFTMINKADADVIDYSFIDQDIRKTKLKPMPEEQSLRPFHTMRLILTTIKDGGFIT